MFRAQFVLMITADISGCKRERDGSEIEDIVNKHESVLKKYRGLYILQTCLQLFWSFTVLFVLFNMRDLFLMFSTFEPYTGAKYNILGFGVIFETLGLIFLAFVFSLILTAIRYITELKRKMLFPLLEEKYPVLKERLRTAYDNRNTDNIIVRDLIGGVIIDSKPVKSSSFLNRRKLAKNLLVIVFAGFCSCIHCRNRIPDNYKPH